MKFVRDIKNAKNISIEISWKIFTISWKHREYLELIVRWFKSSDWELFSEKNLRILNEKLDSTFKLDEWLDNLNLWIEIKAEEEESLINF